MSNVSTSNMALCRGQHVACELQVCGSAFIIWQEGNRACLKRILNEFNIKADWLFEDTNKLVTKLVDVTICTVLVCEM